MSYARDTKWSTKTLRPLRVDYQDPLNEVWLKQLGPSARGGTYARLRDGAPGDPSAIVVLRDGSQIVAEEVYHTWWIAKYDLPRLGDATAPAGNHFEFYVVLWLEREGGHVAPTFSVPMTRADADDEAREYRRMGHRAAVAAAGATVRCPV